MIYVRTCAYNAEKTLKRTIESILKQTYGEFRYYILDNGSTDGTKDIIRKYAESDNRIVPFYAERNHDYTECFEFWNMYFSLQDDDYICALDADDAYDEVFLEEMLRFLQKNKLDFAMCGSVFMDAKTWTPFGERTLAHDLLLVDQESFEKGFPMAYWNFRAIWGKLYSARAAKYSLSPIKGLPEWYPYAYGGDTVEIFSIMEHVERIGILAKPLHLYSVSSESVSYRWAEGREKSDTLLFQKGEELLIKKCGRVSPDNYRMLFAVYFNAVSDTVRVLFEAKLVPEKRLEIINEIFFHPITQKMFTMQFDVPNEKRIDFFAYVVVKLLSLYKSEKDDIYEIIKPIFCNINPDFSKLLTRESFSWYMENCPIVMRNVILREYEYAANNLIVYLSKEGKSPSKDYPYVLGQQLTAMREDERKYVYFSKRLLHWCIMNGQLERAEHELEEWREMLPEDEELMDLQKLFDVRR